MGGANGLGSSRVQIAYGSKLYSLWGLITDICER